jgi:outer membrane protein assembly factor BamB
VGRDGTVYVGSADTRFYALSAGGKLRWRFKTGGLIDSAAALGRGGTVTVGSGDERLYHLRTARRPRKRVIWKFAPTQKPATGQLVNWWEGNVVVGPGGTLYAGNTGGAEYAINPNGKQKWVYSAGNSVWTAPAFADNGTAFVGSLDLMVHAIDRNGKGVWKRPTLNFVVSSPALGRDGTLYIGSFDSHLYALDSKTGAPKWSFASGDHIYASPALREDAAGKTTAIYIASADGNVYALDPSGKVLWRYDTGDVVRSSPVLGRTPDGKGQILYVGSGNGTLFALDAATGRRRWSYDTTPKDPALRDRNDLNGSPALGRRGVYIGGEDGYVHHVPYDWCLKHADRRCSTSPGQAFGDELTRVFPVTSGGTLAQGGYPGVLPPATSLTGRLVVRRQGQTQDASMQPVPSAKSLVQPRPPFDFTAETSGDGHYLFVTPSGFLQPSTDYSLRVSGAYSGQGLRVGNLSIGATSAAPFADTIHFRTAPAGGPLPLRKPARRSVSAFRLRRLAVPLPAFVPSINQIGFDQYELVAGALKVGGGKLLLWVLGVRRDRHGRWVADPKSTLSFPLDGRYQGSDMILSGSDLKLTFSFGDVPTDRFELRGRMRSNHRMTPGASLYSEIECAKVPTYGPFLAAFRLCNDGGKLIASGTYLTQGYATRAGAANRRPPGLSLTSLDLMRPTQSNAGQAVAQFKLARGARYAARSHVPTILLTDAATGAPVPLDYRRAMGKSADGKGNLVAARLNIPAGTTLPASVRAYVITDVFPLGSRVF